jgi:hypothetical protein
MTTSANPITTNPTIAPPPLRAIWYGDSQPTPVFYAGYLFAGTNGAALILGLGDPGANGLIAPQGSLFVRLDGSTSTSLYVCTNAATKTWAAK